MMYANTAITECTSSLILVTSPASERVYDTIKIRASRGTSRTELSSLSVALTTVEVTQSEDMKVALGIDAGEAIKDACYMSKEKAKIWHNC